MTKTATDYVKEGDEMESSHIVIGVMHNVALIPFDDEPGNRVLFSFSGKQMASGSSEAAHILEQLIGKEIALKTSYYSWGSENHSAVEEMERVEDFHDVPMYEISLGS